MIRTGLIEGIGNFDKDEEIYNELMKRFKEMGRQRRLQMKLHERNKMQTSWIALYLQKHPELKKKFDEYVERQPFL